jgi:hypothetical protein
MGYCKADDAMICEECGALIAENYWPEHTRFHEVITSLSLAELARLRHASDEGQG